MRHFEKRENIAMEAHQREREGQMRNRLDYFQRSQRERKHKGEEERDGETNEHKGTDAKSDERRQV